MNKVTVQSSATVKVEINDSGFYIELNPLDMDFPLKMDKASKDLEKLYDLLKQEFLVIDKKEDVKDGLFSRNMKEKWLKLREYNQKCGKIIDDLFGEGTCKAAFGDKNYFGMYNDLLDSLSPVLKEVYGSAEKMLESIKTKYSKTDSDVLKA